MKKVISKLGVIATIAIMAIAMIAMPAVSKAQANGVVLSTTADINTGISPTTYSNAGGINPLLWMWGNGGYGNSFGDNLGELFTLNRLFRGDPILGSDGRTSLGDVFILDQLFGSNLDGFWY
jgi:hypothetical protein